MKINVKVKPNSKEENVEKVGEEFVVKLKSPAREGKANLELLKVLKKYFKAREVKIKSGLSSRKKVVEIIK